MGCERLASWKALDHPLCGANLEDELLKRKERERSTLELFLEQNKLCSPSNELIQSAKSITDTVSRAHLGLQSGRCLGQTAVCPVRVLEIVSVQVKSLS